MMTSPWAALAVLFTARLAMAFQYQAVASLGPLLMNRHGADLADLGVLISLYLLPGLVFAIPGGSIAQRFGDRRVVAGGLAIMILGGAMMWLGQTWSLQILGRILAGIGGVILNVVMTKMLADWFTGRPIATAMAIFVNSWPAGIALALLTLPHVAQSGGLSLALAAPVVLSLLGFFLILAVYTDPPQSNNAAIRGTSPRGDALTGILIAGSVWGTYNAALAMIFAFGPVLLTQRGASLTEASGMSSMVLWIAIFTVPAGGAIADRLGRLEAVLLTGLAAFAACLALAMASPSVPVFALLGVVCGLSAGPIMALPARILRPETRAFGMGLFFSVYYLCMVVFPALAGTLAEIANSASIAFLLGIVLLALAAAGTLLLSTPRFRAP